MKRYDNQADPDRALVYAAEESLSQPDTIEACGLESKASVLGALIGPAASEPPLEEYQQAEVIERYLAKALSIAYQGWRADHLPIVYCNPKILEPDNLSAAERGNVIYVRPYGVFESTALHELAHLITFDAHGPSFRAHHVHLVTKVRGPVLGRALANAYATQGLSLGQLDD